MLLQTPDMCATRTYINIITAGTKIQQSNQTHCVGRAGGAPVLDLNHSLVVAVKQDLVTGPGRAPGMDG